MSWYAIEAIDEAIEDTRELLLPFDLGTWLRLALIVIFTGGGLGFFNPINFIPSDIGEENYTGNHSNTSNFTSTSPIEHGRNAITGLATASSSVSSTVWAAVGILILVILTLFFYISSVFEFIYYQSLLDKDVSIRENFRKHWFNSLQYFGFKISYLIVFVGFIAVLAAGFVVDPVVGSLGLILGIPILMALAVFSGLLHDFVLIQMIETEKDLVSGWRSIWPDLREQWREVFVYLVVKFGIGIVIGIAVGALSFGLLIPFILVFGIIAAIFGFVADILVLIPILFGIFFFLVLMLGIVVVTRTFVYFFIVEMYHSLTS